MVNRKRTSTALSTQSGDGLLETGSSPLASNEPSTPAPAPEPDLIDRGSLVPAQPSGSSELDKAGIRIPSANLAAAQDHLKQEQENLSDVAQRSRNVSHNLTAAARQVAQTQIDDAKAEYLNTYADGLAELSDLVIETQNAAYDAITRK